MASVPVSLGYGYEHGVQQTGRKHGEVDGSSQRHQVRAERLNIYCPSQNCRDVAKSSANFLVLEAPNCTQVFVFQLKLQLDLNSLLASALSI